MEQPIVSYVIPIYRVEPYLEQCVDSVLAQNIRNCEVILVDDGSPDRCGEIADRYGAADSRVKVIHKRNEGLGMARNSGIAAAGGKYLCFVDSDDWLEAPGLDTVIESAERYGADIAVSGFFDWDPAKHCEVYVPPPLPEGVYSHREILEGFWLPMIEHQSRTGACKKALVYRMAWNLQARFRQSEQSPVSVRAGATRRGPPFQLCCLLPGRQDVHVRHGVLSLPLQRNVSCEYLPREQRRTLPEDAVIPARVCERSRNRARRFDATQSTGLYPGSVQHIGNPVAGAPREPGTTIQARRRTGSRRGTPFSI